MARFRLLLAWLLMAALPLQGFAGAAMLFCGGVPAHHVQATGMHDHAGHDHMAHARSDADAQDRADAKQLPSALHTCAICAACCHAVAITQADPAVPLPAVPSPLLQAALGPMHSQPARVPDKPPRA